MKTIASKDSQDSHVSTGATPAPPDEALTRVPNGTSAAAADPPPHPDAPATPTDSSLHVTQPQPPVTTPPAHRYRKWLLLAGTVAALAVGGYFLVPWVDTALNTVSTEDAYVNGHATFVAPRVSGQVMKVLVDDNQRVKKGDLLVQLDKEPYQVQVALKRTAVRAAEVNLAAAEVEGPRPGGPTRRPTLEAPERLRTGRCPGRPLAVPGGRPAESGGHSRPSPGRFQARRGVVAARMPSVVRITTSVSSSCGSRQPPSPRRRRRSPNSECPSDWRPSRKRARNSPTCRRT